MNDCDCHRQIPFAKGDNVLDDQAALVAALLACNSLELDAKSYFVSLGGLTPRAQCSIRGQGPGATTLRTTANNDILRVASSAGVRPEGVSVSDLRLLGDGDSAKTLQVGLEVGYFGGDGANDIFLSNMIAENCGGRGFSVAFPTLIDVPGAKLSALHAINCGLGFMADAQLAANGCTARGCSTGLTIASGNVVWSGGDLSGNGTGVLVLGGGNGAHSIVSSTNINHCTSFGVDVQDNATNGMSFVGCHIYASPIRIGANSGLIDFRSCIIDPNSYTFAATSRVRFTDCVFPMGYPNADNGLGDVEFVNCRSMTGDMPAFIAARMLPRIAVSGATVLTNAQSRAAVLDLHDGGLTTTASVRLARTPAAGERVRAINRTPFQLDVYWATGSGLALPPSTMIDMGADGTNAICEMISSCVAVPIP